MILGELTKLAARLGFDDPVVEPIRAHVAVRIDATGKLKSIKDLPERTIFQLPREALRSSNVAPQALWDKPSYMLGIAPKGKVDRKLENKRIATAAMHDRLADYAPNCPRLAAAARFLHRKPRKLRTDDQNYVLFYENDDEPLGSLPEMRDPLRELRMSSVANLGEGICPITGERDTLVIDNHPKIKPLPGANSSGGSFISFDPPSSWGWGIKGTENMPIGAHAYFGYPTALRWLLANHRTQLSETSTAIWWASEDHPLPDLIGNLLRGDKDARSEAVHALEGLRDIGELELCIAVLAGAQGRASLTWFRKMPAPTVVEALVRHAHYFAVESHDGGSFFPSLRRIILSATRVTDQRRPLRNVRTPVVADLFAGLIGAQTLPRELAHDAMRELDRSLCSSDDIEDALDPVRLRTVFSATAPENGVIVMEEGLDIQRTEPAYVLGSLFSVMEEIQRRAVDSVRVNGRAALAARWLREAKQRPARVFPTIQGVCRQHLIKMHKQRRYYYRYLDDLYLNIQAKLAEYPERLSLSDQGTFMLGYDHMRKALRDHMRFKKASTEKPGDNEETAS